MGISLPRGSVGETGIIETDGWLWKWASFSLWELCEGNVEGQLLYWGP